MIDGVILTPLKVIGVSGGDVLHAMKNKDIGFIDFGEAYFSEVEPGGVKAWKRHTKMTLNLVVPIGGVKFVLFDDRIDDNETQFQEMVLSRDNYMRLTVPPMVWVGFQGMSEYNSLLLNISDIPHDPNEMDKKSIEEIEFNWSV
jgi:dTDP-4-dehydrorhamnose 3,5-epimerase